MEASLGKAGGSDKRDGKGIGPGALARPKRALTLRPEAMKTTRKKSKPASAPTSSPTANVELSEAEIARVAYEIWEEEGRPEGRDLEHWMLARKRLLAQLASPRAGEVPKTDA
jgi:hypothetical protein